MRGLILKDLYCVRFQVILGILLALLPNIIFLFAGGGMMVEFIGTPDEYIAYIPIGLINFITIACFGSFSLNTIKYDTETGWTKYQLTLPVSADRIILSKQLSCIALVLILALCCYVPNVFSLFVFGADAEVMIAMPLIFGMMELICVLCALPISLRYGAKTADIIVIIYLGLLAVLLLLGMSLAFTAGISMTVVRLILYAGLPVLTTAAGYLSNKAAKKLLIVSLERE